MCSALCCQFETRHIPSEVLGQQGNHLPIWGSLSPAGPSLWTATADCGISCGIMLGLAPPVKGPAFTAIRQCPVHHGTPHAHILWVPDTAVAGQQLLGIALSLALTKLQQVSAGTSLLPGWCRWVGSGDVWTSTSQKLGAERGMDMAKQHLMTDLWRLVSSPGSSCPDHPPPPPPSPFHSPWLPCAKVVKHSAVMLMRTLGMCWSTIYHTAGCH